MQDFRKLRVWHESLDVADKVHGIANDFPPGHRFGLADQLKRASDSVPSNIAEGCGRATKKDKLHFWHIALGSVNEVDNDLLRARNLKLIGTRHYEPLHKQVVDVRKMLVSLIITVRNS